MAEGGSSNSGASAGAAGSSDAGAGTAGTAVSTEAAAVKSEGTESSESAKELSDVLTQDEEKASKVEKPPETEKAPEKVGKIIDDKPVTVQEVKDKTTIDKDHVVGEEKKPEEKKEEVKKHKYHDRLIKEFPDRKFASDDEYEASHEEYVKNLEGYRERGTIANQKLVALFEAEPQIADVVSEMIRGATMRSALARHIGAEDLVPEEGDPDYSVWDKNTKERLERIEKSNKFNQEFNENVEFSVKSIHEFAEENKLPPEEAEKILGEFNDMLKDIYRGKITKETLTKITKAVKHDEAVKEAIKDAKEEGEIKGKNEAVKAKKEVESLKKDDGIPALKKTGDTIEETPEKPEQAQIIDRIFGAAKKRSNF